MLHNLSLFLKFGSNPGLQLLMLSWVILCMPVHSPNLEAVTKVKDLIVGQFLDIIFEYDYFPLLKCWYQCPAEF